MRINLVFQIEGVDELKKVTESLNHVASINEIARLEQRLDELKEKKNYLGKQIQSLGDTKDILEREIKDRKKILNIKTEEEKDLVMKDECKEVEDSTVSLDANEGSIR